MPRRAKARPLTIRERVTEALRVARTGRALVETVYDPDSELRSSAGGSAYFKRLTEDNTKDLSPLDQSRMQDIARHLYERNPLAKRLIDRRVAIVLGDGFRAEAVDEGVQEIIDAFWEDNDLDQRAAGDLKSTRIYGEALWPAAVHPTSGAVTLGYIAPSAIEEVIHQKGNIRELTEVRLSKREPLGDGSKTRQVAYKLVRPDRDPDSPTYGMLVGLRGERKGGEFEPDEEDAVYTDAAFLLQANRLPDMTRGTSDLLAIADYLEAYETIMFDLVDRVALLNVLVAQMIFKGVSEKDIPAMSANYSNRLPRSGSVLFTNDAVELKLITPTWADSSVEIWSDLILAIIATGGGVPKYWLNSTMDPNRASAEEMSKPVLRDCEEVQGDWVAALTTVVRFVIDQAVIAGRLPASADTSFQIVAPPLSEGDRGGAATVVEAVGRAVVALTESELLDRETAVRAVASVMQGLGIDVGASAILAALDEEAGAADDDVPPVEMPGDEPVEPNGPSGAPVAAPPTMVLPQPAAAPVGMGVER